MSPQSTHPPTSETFSAAAAVELAVIERSGFVESRHLGSAVVVDPDGAPLIELGAPAEPVLTRSSLKPLQALACLEMGVPLAGESLVLATASHRAEEGHVEVVAGMLESSGLGPEDLQCPAVAPADRGDRMRVRKDGTLVSPLHFNCSGKHAAFLMAQQLGGHDTAAYLDPDSAVQRQVAATVAEYCGGPSDFVGVDGCGAPVHALPLTRLAAGIGRLAAGTTEHARTLRDAVLAHPWAIEGHGRPNSVVVEKLGILAKFGAEGVMVMGTPGGHAVAVKCLDGSSRPTTMVALELLVTAGALPAEQVVPVLAELDHRVTGGIGGDGEPAVVGALRSSSAVLTAAEQLGRR